MLKFKLDQLMATSLIALVVGSSAIADQTPLSVPRYRFEAVKTYNALKAKADAGDEVAQKVLSNYNGDNISKDLNAAKNAATAYNNKDVTAPKVESSASGARIPTVTSSSPRTRAPLQGMASTSTNGDKTEVMVPTNGLAAVRLYSAFKEKAEKGDKVAEQILMKYKGSDFQKLNIAVEAANTYNRLIKTTGMAKPTAEVKTPSEVPILKEELKKAEAQASTKPEGETITLKYRGLAEHCISNVAKYEEEIKALKKELEAAKHCSTAGAPKGKRDFTAEMEELVHQMSVATDPKQLELLNLKIGKLERESAEAGVVLGEAAEKKAAAEEAKKLKELQQQEREALKKVEEDKDTKAYETKGTWLPALSTSKALADYLNRTENDLFASFDNAVQNLKVAGLIEQEGNENVLRALRHMVHKFQGKGSLTQKQKDQLSVLENKIDLKLGSMGAGAKSKAAQGSSFTASADEKRSYEAFQFIWAEAQKDPSSKLFKSINNIRNTDALITLITSPQDSLGSITFDAVKLRSVSFSKATLLELKAFKYALSQARTSSFNPTAARNLIQTIDEHVRNLTQGNVPPNLKERTDDEQKIASRIKVTPAQRKQMQEEQKQEDKAKVSKLMLGEKPEVQDYVFDQMVKNNLKIAEMTNEQLKDKIEQFKDTFEKSKGEEALFAVVSGALPDMGEKDRRDVLKKLLNLNFDFRTSDTPEGKAKIIEEAKKITALNERRRAFAAKGGAKISGPALSPGDSILVRKHLKALYPEKSPQEINSLFNKVASDILAKGLTGGAITQAEVQASAK